MTTDTPRTDAIQFQSRPISMTIENEMLRALSRQLERELNELWSRFDKQMEAEAEVERLKKKFKRAIEIADEFWGNQKQAVLVYHQDLADELDQIKATFNPESK